MNRIIFSKHPKSVKLDVSSAICIFHKKYAEILPDIPNCEYVEFENYKKNYETFTGFEGKEAVVFVGINKFINPSNRNLPVFEHIPIQLPNQLRKISIDLAPYIGELWRIWFHFYFTETKTGDYTYSYLLESHYNAYLEGMIANNPLSYEILRVWAENIVSIDYNQYFAEPEIKVIPLDEEIHAQYRLLKASLFDEFTDINKIIKGLSNFAKLHCMQRSIPQEHKMFETPDRVRIVRTNLKIDDFLTDKLLNKIREVNEVLRVLQ